MRKVETLTEAIEDAKRGEQTMVRCPGHDDGEASLHVAPGTTQPVIMTCHAGCTLDVILGESGIDLDAILAEGFDDNRANDEWTPAGPASHRYRYTDEQGNLLYEVLRVPLPGGKKTFRQRHPDVAARSGWAWSMDGVRRVLYRLPEVLKAKIDGRIIYIVEGEKDVESLRSKGEIATTSPMGAGKWHEDYTQALAGANIVIIPDADATGRAHARAVRESLVAAGCSVAVREAMSGCKDITDHFAAGGTLDTLVETVPEVEEKRESYGVDILQAIERVIAPASFVIPAVLARGDRLLITGFEGHGKSTLLRQLAVQAAAGIHPWTGLDMPAQKVLFIDSENHPDQVLESWQDLVGLCAKHDHPVKEGALTILEEWDKDLDLTAEEGHAWMIERVHAYKPDLICMGPLYNMSGRDLKDDETVRKIKRVVNDARSIYGTAFIMEHHAPHRGPMDRERSVRPYGSSTFLKWPDFGYGLKPTETEGVYEWQKTRFPRVRSRHFPEFMRWGKANTAEFPWMPAMMDDQGTVH